MIIIRIIIRIIRRIAAIRIAFLYHLKPRILELTALWGIRPSDFDTWTVRVIFGLGITSVTSCFLKESLAGEATKDLTCSVATLGAEHDFGVGMGAYIHIYIEIHIYIYIHTYSCRVYTRHL